MEEKLYKYEVSFGIKDVAESPNSSLGTECCRLLLCNERLTVPELFVIEKNLKYQERARGILWTLFREMIREMCNGRRYDPEVSPAITSADDKRDRINFDAEFNLPRGVSCRAQFKFSSGWEYVSVVLKTGSWNKPKVIKKTDLHWLDFFETFGKKMGAVARFDDILICIADHARKIIDRN